MSLAIALVLAAGAPALADLSQIDGQVAGFTGAAIGEEGGAVHPVDRRLRLRACGAPLALGWHGGRRESVEVRCPDAGGWRLYVPVKAAQPQPAASPAIRRGDAVALAVSGSGFTVSRPGEALEAGLVGQWVRVRTLSGGLQPGAVMRGQVVRPGLVAIAVP